MAQDAGYDRLFTTDERDLLETMLEAQRGEIRQILDDLTEDEARARLVPSLTTPLGLVRHAVFVEKVWFHTRVGGRSRAEVGIGEDIDESFGFADEDTIASTIAEFDAACARSREYAASAHLDDEFAWRERQVNLRFIYVHLIQEYARHCGHGDILNEQIATRR